MANLPFAPLATSSQRKEWMPRRISPFAPAVLVDEGTPRQEWYRALAAANFPLRPAVDDDAKMMRKLYQTDAEVVPT